MAFQRDGTGRRRAAIAGVSIVVGTPDQLAAAATLDALPEGPDVEPEPPVRKRATAKRESKKGEGEDEAAGLAAVNALGVQELLYALTLHVGLNQFPLVLLPVQLAAAAALTPEWYSSLTPLVAYLCRALHGSAPPTAAHCSSTRRERPSQ